MAAQLKVMGGSCTFDAWASSVRIHKTTADSHATSRGFVATPEVNPEMARLTHLKESLDLRRTVVWNGAPETLANRAER